MKQILAILFSFCLFSIQMNAQDDMKIDIDELINETQKDTDDEDDMKLVWWIPQEFWVATMQNDPTISKGDAREFLKAFEDYTIFAIAHGTITMFGTVEYTSEKDLRKSLTILSQTGEKYKPIDEEETSPEVQLILSTFKPFFANLLGDLGENMNFFIFDDMDKKGNRLLDPVKEGEVKLKIDKEEFVWETPLNSLVPKKACPEDGKMMNGTWMYCPWHGEKLEEAK